MALGVVGAHNRRLRQFVNELLLSPFDAIVSVEHLVAVSLVVSFLLWTERPNASRNDASLVLWEIWNNHMRIWSLHCCTEAALMSLVLLLSNLHVFIIFWIPK